MYRSIVYCDCKDCKYNNHDLKDAECWLNEIRLSESGRCLIMDRDL